MIDRPSEGISPTQDEIDEQWKIEVERRIDDVENGQVDLIPGEDVFARIRARARK